MLLLLNLRFLSIEILFNFHCCICLILTLGFPSNFVYVKYCKCKIYIKYVTALHTVFYSCIADTGFSLGLQLHFEYVKLFSLPPTRPLRAKKAASIFVTVQPFVEIYIFISTNHLKNIYSNSP